MTMRDFSLDTYNLYSDRQVVPVYVASEERSIDISPVLFNKVMKKATLFTKLFSIFL